jgi:hypothetical protein
MLSRRTFGSLMGAAACVGGAAASSASAQTLDLDAISLAAHEAAMRLAIAAAKANPFYPFGAVIIGAADRATLAQGVNDGKACGRDRRRRRACRAPVPQFFRRSRSATRTHAWLTIVPRVTSSPGCAAPYRRTLRFEPPHLAAYCRGPQGNRSLADRPATAVLCCAVP